MKGNMKSIVNRARALKGALVAAGLVVANAAFATAPAAVTTGVTDAEGVFTSAFALKTLIVVSMITLGMIKIIRR